VTAGYEHISVREDGVAILPDSGIKVAQLVAEVMAYGWSPEELHFQHPHVSMGQIHSALAYYWDHQSEVHQQIEADLIYADELRRRLGDSPLAARLKAQGLR
jgi:uncharacterized protein (DUF433 family)